MWPRYLAAERENRRQFRRLSSPGDTMNHTYSALALSALALGPASSDVTWSASAQMGSSALGGAALAFGGMWLYRRRTLAD
jgi:hypothetical protein